MPYEMERIDQALAKADLFVSVGTSGAVYPAAGFVQTARYHGARALELNLDPSAGSIYFDESRMGPAGGMVAGWVGGGRGGVLGGSGWGGGESGGGVAAGGEGG